MVATLCRIYRYGVVVDFADDYTITLKRVQVGLVTILILLRSSHPMGGKH